MGALSLRLPDDLDTALSREAEVEARPRSEVARKAIAEYLQRLEKERFMTELVAAATELARDPAAQAEALEIAEATVDDGIGAIIDTERKSGIDPDEKWWR